MKYLVLAMILMGCGTKDNCPKFNSLGFGDKIKVTEGFYIGKKGNIVAKEKSAYYHINHDLCTVPTYLVELILEYKRNDGTTINEIRRVTIPEMRLEKTY